MQAVYQWALRPIDGAGLAYFRMAFGGIMLWEVYRYVDHGWIGKYYSGKVLYFTYPGFSWVEPWPSALWMEIHFYIMAALAALMLVGFLYRFAATLFFFAFSYVFLLEQARYLNHFYMVILVAFLLIIVPAHHTWSLDAWLSSRVGKKWFGLPSSVPQWSYWILTFQVGIVYFYGGIAKLNWDWLHGYPLRFWILGEDHVPIIGPYVHETWMALFLSHAGLLIDLCVVPLLIWKRTRWLGVFFVLSFNLLNWQLFSIGIFPWFMIFATPLFFEPDWPRKLWDMCTLVPADRQQLWVKRERDRQGGESGTRWILAFVALYIAFQLLFPLRHFLYPSIVHWTEEGHKYAWHMKLRSKSGRIEFIVKDPVSKREWTVDPDEYVTARQERKMAARPDMALQFAHWLRDRYHTQGFDQIEVYADSWASLNGRHEQRLIDPNVNLADTEWSLFPAEWIVPLYETLPYEELEV